MRSLIPNAMREVEGPELDLQEIFAGGKCRASAARVISYLHQIYEASANPGPEKIFRENFITEEYFLAMPTTAAFNSEIALCQAILAHASGELSDEAVKSVLKSYLDTHIYIYKPGDRKNPGSREVKTGDYSNWTRGVQLFYLSYGAAGATVNAIQAWLLYLIELKRGNSTFRCVALQ